MARVNVRVLKVPSTKKPSVLSCEDIILKMQEQNLCRWLIN